MNPVVNEITNIDGKREVLQRQMTSSGWDTDVDTSLLEIKKIAANTAAYNKKLMRLFKVITLGTKISGAVLAFPLNGKEVKITDYAICGLCLLGVMAEIYVDVKDFGAKVITMMGFVTRSMSIKSAFNIIKGLGDNKSDAHIDKVLGYLSEIAEIAQYLNATVFGGPAKDPLAIHRVSTSSGIALNQLRVIEKERKLSVINENAPDGSIRIMVEDKAPLESKPEVPLSPGTVNEMVGAAVVSFALADSTTVPSQPRDYHGRLRLIPT